MLVEFSSCCNCLFCVYCELLVVRFLLDSAVSLAIDLLAELFGWGIIYYNCVS